MKVFNLTDVETPVLKQRGLLAQSIGISRRMVAPGEFVEVEDTPEVRAKLEYLLTVGAVSIDQAPPTYAKVRQDRQAQAQGTGHLASVPVRHVALQETKVAGEPVPTSPAEGVKHELERHSPASEVADEEPAEARKNQGKKHRQ
jgi:hypothetical protein